jgi:rubrerythrin
MDLFRDIADRLSTDEAGSYECQACGTPFEDQRQVCPECGGCHIDRTDWA